MRLRTSNQIPPDVDMGKYPKLAQMLYRIDELINDPQAQNNPIIAQLAIAAALSLSKCLLHFCRPLYMGLQKCKGQINRK